MTDKTPAISELAAAELIATCPHCDTRNYYDWDPRGSVVTCYHCCEDFNITADAVITSVAMVKAISL